MKQKHQIKTPVAFHEAEDYNPYADYLLNRQVEYYFLSRQAEHYFLNRQIERIEEIE